MKKLYMLAAGALCAAMASAANGDVTDGWLMLEDFEGTAPEMSAFSRNDGKPITTATVEIATLAKDGNESNHVLQFTTAGNYSDGVQFKATLPEGKTIADYTDIKLDICGVNTEYKPLHLYINGTKVYEQSGNVIGGKGSWNEHTHAISVTGTGNEITIGFYNNTGASAIIAFDNIRLKEKDGGSGEDPDPVEPGTYDESKNGTVTNEWLMVEDFQNTKPGDTVKVGDYYGGNGKGSAQIEIDPVKNTNLAGVFTVTNGDYNTVFALDITLPAGKTLKDYKKVAFDLYRFSDDDNYKQMIVKAADEQIYLDNDYVQQAPATTWTAKEYSIDASSATGNSFTLMLGIKTGKGHYAIDNIRFLERSEPVEPGTYDESKNGTITDGWLMVEDYQNAEPGDAAPLASPWGGEPVNGEAKIEADPANASNLVATYTATAETDKNYNTLFAVNVTLPEGKTLKDYEKVSFKMYRFDSGDDDYKQMLVKVGEEEIYKDVNAEGKDDYVHQADTKTWTVKEYDIAKTVTAGNSFKLIFGVKTENAHYAVDEIRLLERAASVVELDGEPSISISHDTAAGEMTVSYSFNVTGYAGEEIKVVANVDGHEEVIFEEYVPEAENAPMRAAAENRTFSGSLKATHEVLKALANPDVKVSATADDKELFAVTKAPDSTTGITGITADSETKAEYFNLQGIRIANPEPGQLYIRRQGSKAVKIRF